MEYLILLILVILVYILGFSRGYVYREELALMKINDVVQQMTEEEDDIMLVNIEKINGVLYVYSDEDDRFMAQGKTHAEISEVLAQKYPGKRFGASKENIAQVGLRDE